MKITENQQHTPSQNHQSSFGRALGSFVSATVVSRVLGYVRDALVAAYFGGGWITDAFYAAFRIPNLLRRFFGEGALTAALVPVFTDVENHRGKDEANHFLNSVISGLVIVLSIIVVLGVIFAPAVARFVAWGFLQNAEKFALTVDLVRLIFPFLFFISLAAVLTAVLNSRGAFFIPAVVPSSLSIAEIAFILFFASFFKDAIYGLSVAAVVGGALHFASQIPSIYHQKLKLKWVRPFSHPEVKTVFALMIPTTLGLAADQVNSFVDQLCASFLQDGAITALYNSNRVMQLPLALFGIAVASVALPSLSRSISNQKMGEYKNTLNFSLRIANYILIPSLVGLSVLGYPIIQVLFEHGKFTPEFTKLTFLALVPYALGLPAYSATKIMATAFYARKNTKTPVRVALYNMVLHAVLNIALMFQLGVAGLALSTALSAWFQVFVLFIYLRRDIGPMGAREILRSFLSGTSAGIVMGVLAVTTFYYVLPNFALIPRLGIAILVGIGAFFGFSKVFKIKEYRFFVDSLLRRKLSN